MKFVPKKVFILQNGVYKEITYQELSENEQYKGKYFLPLYGMLMEVSEKDYIDFYKTQRRNKYLQEESNRNGTFFYQNFTTDSFNGEDLLIDENKDIETEVERIMLKEKIQEFIETLSEKDRITVYYHVEGRYIKLHCFDWCKVHSYLSLDVKHDALLFADISFDPASWLNPVQTENDLEVYQVYGSELKNKNLYLE